MKMADIFNAQRVIDDIASIGRFHRIQGSKELVEAANFIYQELRNMGVDVDFIVEYYDGKGKAGNMEIPIAWEPGYGEVEMEDRKITTNATPLVIMAHSPPGKASGEVVPIEREDDWNRVKGKIALVWENWRENYKKACESGAKGYVIFRRGIDDALPYVGLFLTKKDLKWAKIPAVAIPESWGEEIVRKRKRGEKTQIKIVVKSKIKDREVLPIILARVGKPPYILFSAHLCHPRPGANDNASGSAMLLEFARNLKDLYKENFRFGFAFLWIPEHIGSAVFLEKYAAIEEYFGVINLDMVGGDRLLFIRTPLSRFSILSQAVEEFLSLANSSSKGFVFATPQLAMGMNPYSMGSDHDIFNFFGIPAVMLITWPYRYYHSSEDSVEKINKKSIEIIGKASLAAALYLSLANIENFARASKMKYLGELRMRNELKVAEILVDAGLYRDSKYLALNMGKELMADGWLLWKRKGLVLPQVIKSKRRRQKFQKFSENRGNLALLHELLMLGEMLNRENSFQALREEYGDFDMEIMEEIINLLQEEDIVEIPKTPQ